MLQETLAITVLRKLSISIAMGVLIFISDSVASCAAESQREDSSFQSFLQTYLGKDDLDVSIPTRFSSASIILDGKSSMKLVYVFGNMTCGTGGCTALLVMAEGSSYRVVQEFHTVRLPIRVLSTSTNGWRDIAAWRAGGGEEGYVEIYRYSGSKYQHDPSSSPKRRTWAGLDGDDLPLREQGRELFP